MRSIALVFAITMITAPAQNSSLDPPTVLSDTNGYDIGPYINTVATRVRLNWYSIIPAAIKGEKGRAVVTFNIMRDGKVQEVRVVESAGNETLARAAVGAITVSSPFSALPSAFKLECITLQFSFLYNIKDENR